MSRDKPDQSDKSTSDAMPRNEMETARQLTQRVGFGIAASHVSEPGIKGHVDKGTESASTDDQYSMALKTIAAVATAVWRAKSKLDAETHVEFPAELRNLPRHIQAAWDALAAGQVQVDDPTGRR